MRKALLQKVVESDSDKFKEWIAFGRERGEAIKPTAVEEVGLNESELVQFADELAGGEGDALLQHPRDGNVHAGLHFFT